MAVRIDKFIWSVRLLKTRSKASEACRNGKVKLNDVNVRPAKTVKIGDRFSLRKGPIVYTYKIKELIKNRVSAKLVENYIEDHTQKEELEKLRILKLSYTSTRAKGLGRPTKKDRREIDSFDTESEELNTEWDDWDDWLEDQTQ